MADLVEHPPRQRDAVATKARLLEAAVDEFAEHGLAGARIDRIADRAGTNKRMIYVYFGSKDELFDAALGSRMALMTDAVPFTPEDLGGYAGGVFDAIVAHPELLRLTTWRNFERAQPTEPELISYREKLAAVRAAQKAGAIDPELPAEDVLAMLMALVTSWLNAAPALKELGRGDALGRRRLAAHRAALVRVVSRALEASPLWPPPEP
jgi:AcrR family transcriptional regulator